MDKRQFLKTSGILVASSIMPHLAAGKDKETARKNWAGNYEYSTDNLHVPSSLDEVRSIVKNCAKIKALGARHSFNGIADSTANQISLRNLTQMSLDRRANSVSIGAGVTYSQLSPYLYKSGYALHNLANIECGLNIKRELCDHSQSAEVNDRPVKPFPVAFP